MKKLEQFMKKQYLSAPYMNQYFFKNKFLAGDNHVNTLGNKQQKIAFAHLSAWCMLLLLVSGVALINGSVYAAVYQPKNDSEIVDTLPKGSLTFQQRMPMQTSKKPSIGEITLKANALISQAYISGDPRSVGQAEALIAPYAAIQSPELGLIRANIYQSTHRFDQARSELEKILQQIPNQSDSLFMLANINLVQGRFDTAREQCEQLQDASLLVLKMICVAQVDSMTGKLSVSAQTISQLMQLNAGLTDEQQRWLHLIAADLALRLNDAALAKVVFNTMDGQSAPALTARTDWLLAHGQWASVKNMLSHSTDNDSLLLRLIISEKKQHDPLATQHGQLLAQRIAIWRQRGETAHQREQAQFAYVMGQYDSALQLARSNWQHQRETADVVIYTHAALRTRSYPDIKIINAWIAQTGFEYPLLTKKLKAGAQAQ